MLNRHLIVVLAIVLLKATSTSHADTLESPILSIQLAKAVSRQIGVDGHVFTPDELASVTELRIENTRYLDLTGIANLTQLKKLVLPGNYISDLSALSSLQHLVHLDLNDNRISDLAPLKSLIKLTYLDLDENLIDDCAPLAGLVNLTSLRLSTNSIWDLNPLNALTRLEVLHVNDNHLRSLDVVDAMRDLVELHAKFNDIADIEVLSRLLKLKNLDVSDNRIEDLAALNKLDDLSNLDVSKNPITSLDPLKNLSELTHLSISSLRLDGDLSPLNGLKNLSELKCTYSQVHDLDALQGLNKLVHLDLQGNTIDTILPLLESQAPFKTINLESNPIGTSARTTQVQTLRLRASVTIDGELFDSMPELYRRFASIDSDKDGVLSFQEAQTSVRNVKLWELDAFDANQDWSISIAELTALRALHPPSMERVWVGEELPLMVLGTRAAPFGTLDQAISIVESGGTIVLTPGTTQTVGLLSKPVTITIPEDAKEPAHIIGIAKDPQQ